MYLKRCYMEMKEMFKEFDFNEKPKKVISVINGLNLPDDYLAFISKHNGGEVHWERTITAVFTR